MSATPAPLPPLDDTFGALLLGCMFSVLLYGMSVVQCLYYYTHYPKDHWSLRLLVAVTFAFDTMPVALVMHSIYHYLIKEFANPAALANMVWSILIEVVFAALIAITVQGFYTLRVWRMSKSIVLTATIFVLSLAEFALTILWLAEAIPLTTFKQLLKVRPITLSINSIQAVVDTTIAVSLCITLHNSRTGFRQTNVMINKLIFFFMNTGLFTSLCAIGVVVSTAASPNSFIYAAFYFCIGRLYTNSLLASLNARDSIHGKAENIDISMPSILVTNTSGITTIPTNISTLISNKEDHDPEQKLETSETDFHNSV